MANFEKDFFKKCERMYMQVTCYDSFDNDLRHGDPNTTHIYIGFFDDVHVMRTFRVPKKKEVTVEWLLDKIGQATTYKNFTEEFKKLLKLKGYTNGVTVYPTSYGIGVFVPFTSNIKEIHKNITELLDELKIQYWNEYSRARWVLRYKISKKSENIERLKEALNK
jgi:hypothetical protein